MARKQYRIRRRVAVVPVVAGGFTQIDLPRMYDYEALFLRLSGSAQVTVAATAVRAEAPCQWVQRAIVVAEGKNVLFNAPMWYASLGNYRRPLIESGARATTPPTGTAIATYAVEAIGVIDFMIADGVRPKDCNLRTSGFSLFQLQLQFGQPGDIFVGGTVNFSGVPTVEVWTAELVEGPDAEGKFAQPIALKKVSTQEVAFTSSNSGLEVRLPAGNNIRAVLTRTEGLTTAGEPQLGVLNNLILQNGIDVRMNLTGNQLRAQGNADYGQILAGYYIADVAARGQSAVQLSEMWDVGGQSEPKAVLDVVGAANTRVQCIVTEFIFADAMAA